jgi:hypothetical protein
LLFQLVAHYSDLIKKIDEQAAQVKSYQEKETDEIQIEKAALEESQNQNILNYSAVPVIR